MPETVRVKGYKETIRGLKQIDKAAAKAVRDGLRAAATPIADEAKSKLSKYPSVSQGTIGVGVTATGVRVTQRKKKVTGKRPDFGALQMTEGLIPALEDHEDTAVADVRKQVDTLIRQAGF